MNNINLLSFEKLGVFQKQINLLEDIIHSKNGAIIISATWDEIRDQAFDNFLEYFNLKEKYKDKIIDINNPIDIKNIDSNYLLKGFISNKSEFEYVEKCVKNGALVVATVFSSNSFNTVDRLIDFGLNKNFIHVILHQIIFTLLSSINSQYIVDMKDDFKGKTEFITRVQENKLIDYKSVRIRESGRIIKDRINVCEFFIPNQNIIDIFKYGDDDSIIKCYYNWIQSSDNDLYSDDLTGKTLFFNSISRINIGLVDPMEVELKLGPMNI